MCYIVNLRKRGCSELMPKCPPAPSPSCYRHRGSTKLWERVLRHAGCPCRHDAILREAIEGHGGFRLQDGGDAFCAAFPTALNALQSALAGRGASSRRVGEQIVTLRARMALHTGSPTTRRRLLRPPLPVARLLRPVMRQLSSLPRPRSWYAITYGGDTFEGPGARHLKDLARPRGSSSFGSRVAKEFPP